MNPNNHVEPTFRARLETHVRNSTFGRIRNLKVEEVSGQFLVEGKVPSQHTKQLALHGALELLSCDRFADGITVETFTSTSSDTAIIKRSEITW